MHFIKPWTNTKGKKILDHPVNTLWRSPQNTFKIFIPELLNLYSLNFYSAHLFTTPFHIVCWVYSIHSLIHIPIDNHRWRKSKNQIVEDIGQHPQMAIVAHFLKGMLHLLIKIKKPKNICCCLLVSQGWGISLAPWTLPLELVDLSRWFFTYLERNLHCRYEGIHVIWSYF